MSTHKNIDIICVAVLVFTLLLTILFMNGERLGIQVVVDEDQEYHSGVTYFTVNDMPPGDYGVKYKDYNNIEHEVNISVR